MRLGVAYGRQAIEIEAREGSQVGVSRQPAAGPLADPSAAVRAALESPHNFPPLRQALTPDDHVAIVLDEHLPGVASLLSPLLEHISRACVSPEAISIVCPPTASRQEWLEQLPDEFEDVHLEVHDPTERRKLSYLATTRQGRRLYLNRTVVDADQVVVLSGRGYDPVLGYSGAEGSLFPALSDEATRKELGERLTLDVPGGEAWPARREAEEVAWLLGAPFHVQVIEGAGDEIAHVLAGLTDTSGEGRRLLDARWREAVEQQPDTVVATVTGDPARHGFADLARAAACAARVVRADGTIVVLSEVTPQLGEAAELLRRADDPAAALAMLKQAGSADRVAAYEWAWAARQARVFLLSGLPDDTAEELFAVPLGHAGQVQRL
ncbi:MAG TPA: lactate racemase domain-containing protein, partial [Gemmataceae bacterium]|nr:lactate racemase domain-containing protein [Gemmataceae bacterium]